MSWDYEVVILGLGSWRASEVLGLEIPPESAASSTLNFVVWKKMEPQRTGVSNDSDAMYVFATVIDGNFGDSNKEHIKTRRDSISNSSIGE